MSGGPVTVVDSLSLLSLKVAPNVFDLSSGLHHISIRDQIVRAQLLVRDLVRADPQLRCLLIVGAGVAGIAAALEAVERGVEEIVVLERTSRPFDLLHRVSTRHVGPFMYEWPQVFAQDQSYPSHAHTPWSRTPGGRLHWTAHDPLPADQLARALESHLLAQLRALAGVRHPRLSVRVHVDPHWVAAEVRAFVKLQVQRLIQRLQSTALAPPYGIDIGHLHPWVSAAAGPARIEPQYVLLAAGMGAENVQLIPGSGGFRGQPFWQDDRLRDAATAHQHTAIFGGGDGALQDLLRALTVHDHPLAFIDALASDPMAQAALAPQLPGLLALDRQARQYAGWTRGAGVFDEIDRSCAAIAARLAGDAAIWRAVCAGIRDGGGQVSLFVRDAHFDKTYLLNRFMVHLLWAGLQDHPAGFGSGKMTLDIRWRHQARAWRQTHRHELTIEDLDHATGFTIEADQVVVRYGIETGTVPGAQMIQVSRAASAQRTTLSRVELPVVGGTD